MKIRCLATACFALTIAALGTARADFVAEADLNGASEVPPNASPAFGFAIVTYTTATDSLFYEVTFTGLLAPATAGHIHFGDPGIAGPVILPLSNVPNATSGTFVGTLTSANLIPRPAVGINTFADAIAAIQGGHTYVNLHDSTFPGGEIRGQLRLRSVPEPASLILTGMGLVGLVGYGWGRRRRMVG